MRKIYLHGRLKRFGFAQSLAVDTVGETVRFLSQIDGFVDELKKGSYELIRGDVKTGLRIDLDEVNTLKLGKGELHIVPVVAGKKRAGLLKVVLGVALIGAAIFFSGGTLAAPLAGMATNVIGGVTFGNLATMGLGMVLAGVAQMLTPSTDTKGAENQDSFALGPNNTSGQGAPVPYIYGEVITGSNLISAGMDVEPIPIGWNPLKGYKLNYAGDPT